MPPRQWHRCQYSRISISLATASEPRSCSQRFPALSSGFSPSPQAGAPAFMSLCSPVHSLPPLLPGYSSTPFQPLTACRRGPGEAGKVLPQRVVKCFSRLGSFIFWGRGQTGLVPFQCSWRGRAEQYPQCSWLSFLEASI